MSSTADEDLFAADELLDRPFPEREGRDASGSAGPGFHLLVLQASRDFWDCPDETVVQEAEADLQTRLDALEAKLVARWGDPREIDLWPYLRAGLEGAAVPEPIVSLCQLTGSMRVWLRPDTGRWLALTIGQGDKELPFELIVAVGEKDRIDPTGSLQEGPEPSEGARGGVNGLGTRSMSFTARPLPKAVEAFGQGEQVR